jgi:hypothetical protein
MPQPKPVHLPEGYYMGVGAYAKKSGLSEATVKRRCIDGSLPAKKVGERSWFILVDRLGKVEEA